MKGYFNINTFIALSLAITIFSFVGIPPLIGFFAKQMVLSSALDNGYVFMALIAILTSVISAYYYLALVRQIFFHDTNYTLNPQLENITMKGNIVNRLNGSLETINVGNKNIVLSSSLSVTISVLTLVILLFILNPQE
ncbi:MAG: proton-conducting transporter membrane subunit [Rickettsia endosymbiont of Ixodes persulcatus]|nr:proton-conducting transporter membrane subunit [Rickettsia endosymbiont of Ixodes persulcatus]